MNGYDIGGEQAEAHDYNVQWGKSFNEEMDDTTAAIARFEAEYPVVLDAKIENKTIHTTRIVNGVEQPWGNEHVAIVTIDGVERQYTWGDGKVWGNSWLTYAVVDGLLLIWDKSGDIALTEVRAAK